MDKKNKEFKKLIEKLSTKELIKILENRLKNELDENDSSANNIIKEEIKPKGLFTGHLEGFNKEFETHIQLSEKEVPILMYMVRDFVSDIYQPSKIYLLALEAESRINEELQKTLNENQKYLLEQLEYCKSTISDDLIEQSFIYGYAMNEQLKMEALKKYKLRKST